MKQALEKTSLSVLSVVAGLTIYNYFIEPIATEVAAELYYRFIEWRSNKAKKDKA